MPCVKKELCKTSWTAIVFHSEQHGRGSWTYHRRFRHSLQRITGLATSQYKDCLSKVWDSHVKDTTVARQANLLHGDPYTNKTKSLYWDGHRKLLPSHTVVSWLGRWKCTVHGNTSRETCHVVSFTEGNLTPKRKVYGMKICQSKVEGPKSLGKQDFPSKYPPFPCMASII